MRNSKLITLSGHTPLPLWLIDSTKCARQTWRLGGFQSQVPEITDKPVGQDLTKLFDVINYACQKQVFLNVVPRYLNKESLQEVGKPEALGICVHHREECRLCWHHHTCKRLGQSGKTGFTRFLAFPFLTPSFGWVNWVNISLTNKRWILKPKTKEILKEP